MFPAFFDLLVLRNRENTGLVGQILAKSYDIRKLTDGVRPAGFQFGSWGQKGWKALFPSRGVRGLFHGDHSNMESDN